MAPLPKRKHSTRRKGKRRAALKLPTVALSVCKHCNTPKQTHTVCQNCGKY